LYNIRAQAAHGDLAVSDKKQPLGGNVFRMHVPHLLFLLLYHSGRKKVNYGIKNELQYQNTLYRKSRNNASVF
jgi:hypothetical protein